MLQLHVTANRGWQSMVGGRPGMLAWAVCTAMGAGQAFAASTNWGSTVEDGNWANPDNWAHGTEVPGNASDGVTGTNDIASFWYNSNIVNVMVDEGRTVGGLSFGSHIGPYVFDGQTLTLARVSGNASIAASSPGAGQPDRVITFNTPLELKSATNIAPVPGRTFAFNGGITSDAAITVSGTGSIVLNSPVTWTGGYTHPWGVVMSGHVTVELTDAQIVSDKQFRVVSNATALVNAANAFTGNANPFVGESGTIDIRYAQDHTGTTYVGINSGSSPTSALWVNNDPLLGGSGSGTGQLQLRVGGILGGTGTVGNSSISMNHTSALSPGDAAGEIGTLTITSASLDLGNNVGSTNYVGTLLFDLLNPQYSDRIDLTTGALDIGTDILEFDDFVFTVAGSDLGTGVYTLFDTNAPIVGTLGSSLSGAIGDFTGTIGLGDNGQDIILTIIPEPASLTLLTMGGVVAFIRGRRERQ